ncbi:MAG: fumarylacetoacetate hydrolase family protein [Tepidimonas taiwanensis]|nr:fumarylacetoacetate hydrolase family protein [Tepidimonas taiwanensis]
MKLATYRDGSRDGQLVVVSRDGTLAHYATGIADTLQQALDDWNFVAPQLQDLALTLEHGKARHAFAFDPEQCAAPLPRAWGWLAPAEDDGVLQSWRSDMLWGPTRGLPAVAGVADIGATVGVVCGDVAADVEAAGALDGVRLLVLACHWRWGGVADEAPAQPWGIAVAPCAVTPDELGAAWVGGRLDVSVTTSINGRKLGIADGGAQARDFGALIAAAARGRGIAAGVVVTGGTLPTPQVPSEPSGVPVWPRGYATVAARRAAERHTLGAARTPWLAPGDRVQLEARMPDGGAPFGAIDVTWPPATAHSEGVAVGWARS